MRVSEAINSRHSMRVFKPDPVPRADIEWIVTTANRAASNGNLQPWKLYITRDLARQRLSAAILKAMDEDDTGPGGEYDVYPKAITEPYLARRSKCGEDMYAVINVPREDKAARIRQFARNYELFGAPVGLFFVIDRQMGFGQWADLGMFMQSIMLLAREYGLHTCPQEAWAAWYKSVGDFLQLPPQLMFFCGMALGFRDESAPTRRADRR